MTQNKLNRRAVLSSASLLVTALVSQGKNTSKAKKDVNLEFKIIRPNLFKLTFVNNGSEPVNIWSPSCSLFWDGLILVCTLKSGERTWQLWSEKGFTRNIPTTVKISPHKFFEIDVDIENDGWPAVSRISDIQSKHGYDCVCVAEWDAAATDEALRKKYDVHIKASSDRIPIKLSLSGIY